MSWILCASEIDVETRSTPRMSWFKSFNRFAPFKPFKTCSNSNPLSALRLCGEIAGDDC
jgi:hypothetical protein